MLKNKSFIFFQHQYQKQVMIGISWLVSHEVCIIIQDFFGVVRNEPQLLNIQS